MLEAVREMPCDEDFEPWDTNARKDFLRKWYHTRSKKVQTVSLEELMESGEDDSIFYLPDPSQNVEDYVIAKDFVERFLTTLGTGQADRSAPSGRIYLCGNCGRSGARQPQRGHQTDRGREKEVSGLSAQGVSHAVRNDGRGFFALKNQKKEVFIFNMKNLPPVERRADGSLYHMDGKQRRETVRLIKGLCSYYDNGNCLYLDRGEAVTCPQSNSYSVCCKFFRHVLLKDQEGKGLEAGIFQREALKRCAVCGKPFSSTSNSAKYCGTAKRRFSGSKGRIRPPQTGGAWKSRG